MMPHEFTPDADALAAMARETIKISRSLYPVEGLIVSPSLDTAFEKMRARFPDLRIHAWPTGAVAGDWTVPPAWRAVRGHLKSESGETIASLDESFLFVAPYSQDVDGRFTKAEMAPRVRTRPDRPHAYALEHRYAYDYSLKNWGITLPHARWAAMSDDARYHVRIETQTLPGALRVAEWVLPGESPEVICVSSQFDELCNDGQSSAIAGALVFDCLRKIEKRKYTYQLLLVPEMFGAIFFAHDNREIVRRTIGMLNLETLGAGREWCLKRAHRPGSALERALRLALRQNATPFRELGFFEGYGNDERIYAWPAIDVPGPALQHYPFDAYHTSDDTPDILAEAKLRQAFDAVFGTIAILETDATPQVASFVQPWLTKHGLYVDRASDPNMRKLNDEVLYSIDGKTKISELAEKFDIRYADVRLFLERCRRAGVVEFADPAGSR